MSPTQEIEGSPASHTPGTFSPEPSRLLLKLWILGEDKARVC